MDGSLTVSSTEKISVVDAPENILQESAMHGLTAKNDSMNGPKSNDGQNLIFLEKPSEITGDLSLEILPNGPSQDAYGESVEQKNDVRLCHENDNKVSTNIDNESKNGMQDSGSFDESDELVLPETTNIRASSSRTVVKLANSVTPRRKEELLLEARKERIRWVQQVPLPYDVSPDRKSSLFLQYSHASRHLPAATQILEHLYGHACVDQLDDFVMRHKNIDRQHVLLSGNQILSAELASTVNEPTKSLLKSYQYFLNQLQDPSLGMLVQGIRHFCRNFREIKDVSIAATNLKAYVVETYNTIARHVIFRKIEDKVQLRRSFESFLFGHVRSHLDQLYWQASAISKDKAFVERLTLLQFVTPTHLDIACLANNQNNNDSLKELLSESIAALRAMNSYHSVYEKLQQILTMYHAANKALKVALNRNGGDKLPSADDILPTIILTVIIARSERLHYNLQLVEELSPAEYLRGEAGYAFTNLFGAVQFIQELDLEKEPVSLSISKESSEQGIAVSKAAIQQHIEKIEEPMIDHTNNILASLPSTPDDLLSGDILPPVHEMRMARLAGVKVDLEWALQWQEHCNNNIQMLTDTTTTTTPRDSIEFEDERLPPGFRRQYTFLNKRSEDIRMTDLPLLLEEYRMLVHTTESLLGERAMKAAAARKVRSLAMEKEILSAVHSVDPSLLPHTDSEVERNPMDKLF